MRHPCQARCRFLFVVIVVCFVMFFLGQSFSMYPWLSWNSLCRPGWLQTHRDPPASVFASQVLGLQAYATTIQLVLEYYWLYASHLTLFMTCSPRFCLSEFQKLAVSHGGLPYPYTNCFVNCPFAKTAQLVC